MANVLLVEDDAPFRQALQVALEASGYRVLATDLCATAWHLFGREKTDLAILDISLPDGSGLDMLAKIRSHPEAGRIPVILLTAKSEFETKEDGFKAGADQYLVKPVAPKEVLLWVEALLRRLDLDKEKGESLGIRDGAVDVDARLVRFKEQTVSNLTGKEFDLFCYLVRKRPQVVSRRQILSRLWHTIAVERVVDTHLHNLRKKLPKELADRLQAVPGKGFRYLE